MSIEEPFSILPLCHICGTIRSNVTELLAATAGGPQGLGGEHQGGLVPPALLVGAALRSEACSGQAQL